MAEFLNTKRLSFEIEKIITNSKKYLILASPFLQISEAYHRQIVLASKRGVQIRLIYGKNSNKSEKTIEREEQELAIFKKLENCSCIYVEHLHAKCFLNEEAIIIGSMNLYTFSENNNVEMGVLLNSRSDRSAFKEAMNYVNSIVELYGDNDTIFSKVEKEVRVGFCIRCNSEIEYSPMKPFCLSCYSNNSYRYSPYTKESFCHSCGDPHKVTFSSPIHYACAGKKTKVILVDRF